MKRLDRSARAPLRNPIVRVGAPVGAGAATVELEIAEMGARGDAVAAGPEGPIYLPYALPGERVRARYASDRGEVLAVLTPSAARQGAPCAHFGRCGGCQLQHWREAPYLTWKRDQVVRALERRGIGADVAAIEAAWGEGRRRATLHAGPGGAFGFIARGGAAITPVDACPVLAPALQRALPGLRRLGQAFAPARGDLNIQALASETGVDVNVKGAGAPGTLSAEAATRAAAIAEAEDFARLSFDGEALAHRRAPALAMGLTRVSPPPGAFLQPTARGEETLARLVLAGLEGAACVADLFSGLGTFALRIAARAETHAYDGEEAMLAALRHAADHASGLKPVRATRRDLLRTPLSALEMKRFDAVVFDPPRSGARLQAEQIARSRVRKAVAVSCDPATFARDARALIDGGFSIVRITPVDQFRWSPHIEIVGVFER
ncbi:MAG: class I SAM-dependent RNA methyltransferase [Hyphomonadaceae bacterium]